MANKTGTFYIPAKNNYGSQFGRFIINWTCISDTLNNRVGFNFEAYLEVTAESAFITMTPNDWIVYTTIDPVTTSTTNLAAKNPQLVSATYSFRDSYYSNDIFCQEGIAQQVELTTGTYFVAKTSTVYIGHGDEHHTGFFTNPFIFQQAKLYPDSAYEYYTSDNLSFTFGDYAGFTPVTERIEPFVLIEGSEAMDRSSAITCGTTTIGEQAIITASKFSYNDTNTIYYSVPEARISNVLIATKTSANKLYWDVPVSIENNLISGTTSVQCILSWITYDVDGNEIGGGSYTFTLLTRTIIGLDKYPKFDPVFTINNKGVARNDIIIRYFSDVTIDPRPTPESGTDTKVSITNGNQTISGYYSVQKKYMFEEVTSNEFTFYGKDSDENENTYRYTYPNYVYYIPLTCRVQASTIDSFGGTTLTIHGDCYSGSFGYTPNELTIQYRYSTVKGEGNWHTATGDFGLYNNSYGIDIDISGLDYTKQYYFEAKVWDSINIAGVQSNIASSLTEPIFYWNNDEFVFNLPVTLNKGMTVGGNIIQSFDIYPANFESVEDSVISFGRYSISGEVVTLSFYYQGEVFSQPATLGYSDVAPIAFQLEGIPYPRQYDGGNQLRWFAGGGHCSGWTALQNNHAFSGWTIGYDDGPEPVLVARSQGPVAAGATGGNYYVSTKPGNIIYCSGTISYVMEEQY